MNNIYDVITFLGFFVILFSWMYFLLTHETDKPRIKLPKCWPFHDYGPWLTIAVGDIAKKTFIPSTGYEMDLLKGYAIRQQEICKDCGKTKLRTEKTEI
jgi:hypothetical protein